MASEDDRPFRWLSLKHLSYKDPNGTVRDWEMCERTTKKGEVDAVVMLARLVGSGAEERIVIISQYRPPMKSQVLEFPAGLVDPDEGLEQAALR